MTDNEKSRLLRQLAEYDTIFSTMPVMLWYKDDKNTTIRINDAAAAFEGVDRSLVEGKSGYDVYPREQAEAFYQDDLEVLKSGKPKLNIIEQHVTPAGDIMWVHTNKVPIHDEKGHVVGVIAIAVDVTERERARAELEAKNQQLERVHEFIQATFDHIEESAGHGADRNEILAYIVTARAELEKLRG